MLLVLLDPEDQVRVSSGGQEAGQQLLASPRGQTLEEVSAGDSLVDCPPHIFFLFFSAFPLLLLPFLPSGGSVLGGGMELRTPIRFSTFSLQSLYISPFRVPIAVWAHGFP